MKNFHPNFINSRLSDVLAVPFQVSTARLKVTSPMFWSSGTLTMAHSSTCSSVSLTIYMVSLNPTSTPGYKNISWDSNGKIIPQLSNHFGYYGKQ